MDTVNIASFIFVVTGTIVIILLALREVYDIAERVGILDLIPHHVERKRREEEERFRKILQLQNEVLQQDEQRRVEHLLDSMGIINRRYLADLRQAMEFISMVVARSGGSYQQELRQLCVKFTVDQNQVPKDKIVLYPIVRFYVDLVKAATNTTYGEKLAEILQALIAAKLSQLKENPLESLEFNKIAVPYGGNYFLALQLAKRLVKPLVVILHEPRMTTDCFWMGDLNPSDKLIIADDLCVTGRKIADCAETIRKRGHAEIKHIFVLVERKEGDARKFLAEFSEPLFLHSMLVFHDQELEALLRVTTR